jgi:hypothetical protein
MTDIELIEEMRELLIGYVLRYPAFRTKPVGAPDSLERHQQDMDINRENRARIVLALRPGFASAKTGDAGG